MKFNNQHFWQLISRLQEIPSYEKKKMHKNIRKNVIPIKLIFISDFS